MGSPSQGLIVRARSQKKEAGSYAGTDEGRPMIWRRLVGGPFDGQLFPVEQGTDGVLAGPDTDGFRHHYEINALGRWSYLPGLKYLDPSEVEEMTEQIVEGFDCLLRRASLASR